MILSNSDVSGTVFVADMLRAKIDEMWMPHDHSSLNEHVNISIGAATLVPDEKTDSVELIILADQALYRVKKNGRNRVEV